MNSTPTGTCPTCGKKLFANGKIAWCIDGHQFELKKPPSTNSKDSHHAN